MVGLGGAEKDKKKSGGEAPADKKRDNPKNPKEQTHWDPAGTRVNALIL